jgi:4-amino-4-deoxy-L-arabinose transferase-like glycosyltransferase
MPLPFYVIGLTQLLFGRDLWAARLVSAAIGLAVFVLLVAVVRRLDGRLAAVLAALLAVTQGVLVGYFATAMYISMTACLLLAAVWLMLRDDLPWHATLGMATASLLFFTRVNLFPAIPFFLGWALARARRPLERVAIVAVTVGPPVAFFLWDPLHLKLLSHVPVVQRLMEPLGYKSVFELQELPMPDLGERLGGIVLLARRYESWVATAAGVLGAALIARARGRSLAALIPRGDLAVVVALFGWLFATQLVIFRMNYRWLAAYFPVLAPLAVAILGIAAARLVARVDLPRLARATLFAGLAAGLTISVIAVRHPLLPTPRAWPFRGDAIQLADAAASDLRRLIPAGTRVFLFGPSTPVYLASLDAYPSQMWSSLGNLVETRHEQFVPRSGVWGPAELERWLGVEARYAVVAPDVLPEMERLRPRVVARMRELLRERFELVGRAEGRPWLVYEVYRRRQ